MIASLPMYERHETSSDLAALWTSVRDTLMSQGIKAPNALSSNVTALDLWRNDALVLSQTCGLPYRAALHEHVKLLGAPDVRIKGCAPGFYCSAIVVRADDSRTTLEEFQGATIVCNSLTSQSGYAAFKQHWEVASLTWPEHSSASLTFSNAHRASATAVASGNADITALDYLSFRLMRAYDTFSDRLRILELTKPTPALPFICAAQFNAETIASALRTGVDSLTHKQRENLGIYGIVDIPVERYRQEPTPTECLAAF